jgi:hypothetical protein
MLAKRHKAGTRPITASVISHKSMIDHIRSTYLPHGDPQSCIQCRCNAYHYVVFLRAGGSAPQALRLILLRRLSVLVIKGSLAA